MHILLFIESLETGGAQRQLVQLAVGLQNQKHSVIIATIFPGGQFWDQIKHDNKVAIQSLFKIKYRNAFLTGIQLIGSAILL